MAIQSPTHNQIQPVAPGDLITAAFFNRLIAAVQDLEDRVADLEDAPTPGTGPSSPPRGPSTPGGPGNVIGGAVRDEDRLVLGTMEAAPARAVRIPRAKKASEDQ